MKDGQRQPTKKCPTGPQVADKIELWLSTSRDIDGLWVGTMEGPPQLGLRRAEDALRLIKHYSPLHYSRVLHHLERVWVKLTPHGLACYERSLEACVLDERFVLAETTTVERIATTIVHEATHARLEHWGIPYDEEMRTRIEAICCRRELAFAIKLPDSAQLQEEIAASLEFYGTNSEFYSDANFHDRELQGQLEALRHLGAPEWVTRAIPKMRPAISTLRSVFRRLRGREFPQGEDVPRFGQKTQAPKPRPRLRLGVKANAGTNPPPSR